MKISEAIEQETVAYGEIRYVLAVRYRTSDYSDTNRFVGSTVQDVMEQARQFADELRAVDPDASVFDDAGVCY